MNSALKFFISEFAGVVLAALAPVVLVAFLSIPYSLGGHPGEARADNTSATLHMT